MSIARALFVALLLPALATAQQGAAAAADSVLEARTAQVAATLRCPVCQGESIQDSPAELAQQMRLVVKDMLREGKTPDDIRTYFVGRYGEWILLEPKMTGLNIVLYVLPVVLILAGGIFVVRFVRRSAATPPAPGNDGAILQ
jgi:cytochrome c-type biogenesis protein CcmH